MGYLVRQVCQDRAESRVYLANQDQRVQEGFQGHLEFVECQDRKDNQELTEVMAIRVQAPTNLVHQDLKVLLALLVVHQEKQEAPANQESADKWEHLVPEAFQDLAGPRVQEEKQVHLDHLDLLDANCFCFHHLGEQTIF